jgi:hypothetical protein
MLLRVLLPEAGQVAIGIPAIRIGFSPREISRSLIESSNEDDTSLRYSAMSLCVGSSGESSFHNLNREISSLLICNADFRPSTNFSIRRDCAAFVVGR